MTRFFETHILPFIKQFENQSWRESRLWCEECDLVLKDCKPALDELFTRYSGRHTKPGQARQVQPVVITTRAGS